MMARFLWYLDPLINFKKKKVEPSLKKLSGSVHGVIPLIALHAGHRKLIRSYTVHSKRAPYENRYQKHDNESVH